MPFDDKTTRRVVKLVSQADFDCEHIACSILKIVRQTISTIRSLNIESSDTNQLTINGLDETRLKHWLGDKGIPVDVLLIEPNDELASYTISVNDTKEEEIREIYNKAAFKKQAKAQLPSALAPYWPEGKLRDQIKELIACAVAMKDTIAGQVAAIYDLEKRTGTIKMVAPGAKLKDPEG
eukprot:TRINITY_DN1607_c0_g1_i1.p2 TRINITY_DN1607_c0_g1~~TRINITY_DN1607_c0_g1_i1.p2  ORF type:complete len:180 (+),score=30.84 TRINITY_DN1607_c0_g1_i1:57-596(+)